MLQFADPGYPELFQALSAQQLRRVLSSVASACPPAIREMLTGLSPLGTVLLIRKFEEADAIGAVQRMLFMTTNTSALLEVKKP